MILAAGHSRLSAVLMTGAVGHSPPSLFPTHCPLSVAAGAIFPLPAQHAFEVCSTSLPAQTMKRVIQQKTA